MKKFLIRDSLKNQHYVMYRYIVVALRNDRSTSTVIISLFDRILNYLDVSECTTEIFCDLSKAFDNVNYKLLLLSKL